MSQFDPNAPKKAKNLYLNQSLLALASSYGINVSKACEQGILAQIRELEARKWREDNQAALQSANDYVERHGLPLSRYRSF